MEDGRDYQHPRVGFFDAGRSIFSYSIGLDHSLQPDGVPWIARWDGQLVTSAWNPAPASPVGHEGQPGPQHSTAAGAGTHPGREDCERHVFMRRATPVRKESGEGKTSRRARRSISSRWPDVGEQEGIALGESMLHTLNVTPTSRRSSCATIARRGRR